MSNPNTKIQFQEIYKKRGSKAALLRAMQKYHDRMQVSAVKNASTEHNTSMTDPSDNLEELVKRMNEQQQLNFKKAVVRQTIYYVSKCLPIEENDEGERRFIDIANHWLKEPTDKNAENANLAIAADYIDGGMRYFDYPAYFLEPASAAGASAYGASLHALAAAEADSPTAYQWQMTVAWAILNNEDIPSLK